MIHRVIQDIFAALASGSFDGEFAAAGSVQADATPLNTIVADVTGGNGTKGVLLPLGEKGTLRAIYNNSASGLKVYPNTGDDINDGTVNSAVTVDAHTFGIFYKLDGGTWAARYAA